MNATLLFSDKYIYADAAIREMVIWRLPKPDPQRVHGLKYRLYYGFSGKDLLRYDNEKGKGDHRHYKSQEEAYVFMSVERLIFDFRTDINRLRGERS
ncbi:MAG: DUF6516 family protein [Nitrospirota bacterium]|nr:DUF6516 family protein [Nitrospirota bacterium]